VLGSKIKARAPTNRLKFMLAKFTPSSEVVVRANITKNYRKFTLDLKIEYYLHLRA